MVILSYIKHYERDTATVGLLAGALWQQPRQAHETRLPVEKAFTTRARTHRRGIMKTSQSNGSEKRQELNKKEK